jgi:hypothetical protein
MTLEEIEREYSARAIAQRSGVSYDEILAAVHAGGLRHRLIGTGKRQSIKITVSDFEEWRERQKHGGDTRPLEASKSARGSKRPSKKNRGTATTQDGKTRQSLTADDVRRLT